MEFIVGTVLGAVPIVLEAFDRYQQLSKGFHTFRHYPAELRLMDTTLQTYKTLFRANVIDLLAAITKDRERAERILSANSKEEWDKLRILVAHDDDRLLLLRDMFTNWKATLNVVHSSLMTICSEVERCAVSEPLPKDSSSTRHMLKQLSKRLRLCWKKDEVQGSIQELRNLTVDFDRLTSRIVSELERIQNTNIVAGNSATTPRQPKELNVIRTYLQIQSASQTLYKAFARRWSCARHSRHAVSISLVKSGKASRTEQKGVQFDVAIDGVADIPATMDALIWLEVITVNPVIQGGLVSQGQDSEPDPPAQAPTGTWIGEMERISQYSRPMAFDSQHKVSKQTSSSQSTPVSSSTTSVTVLQTDSNDDSRHAGTTPATISTAIGHSLSSTDVMLDLTVISDFCEHFQVGQPIAATRFAGYIKDLGLHQFYLPPQRAQPPGQQKSLAEIITWVSEDKWRSLDRIAVARLASSLATAILQYHSTPWLPETWQSSCIRFFGIGELSDDSPGVSLPAPYFRVEFLTPHQEGFESATAPAPEKKISENEDTAANPNHSEVPEPIATVFARNQLLFRFGVVLLELGYCQPWPVLREEVLPKIAPRKRTDYFAAEKLAQMPFLHHNMGPRYANIVRKCIGCDFGLGENDLANIELQKIFLKNVVEALQKEEEGLKMLEAGNC